MKNIVSESEIDLYNQGVNAHKMGQLDEAVKNFNKALSIKPNYAEAYNKLGHVLRDLDQDNEAIVNYKKAIEFKSNYAEAHYNLAMTQHYLGHIDEAIESYKKVLVLKPEFAELHNSLGVIFRNRGDIPIATEHFTNALDLKPDFEEAHLNLGKSYQIVGNNDMAIQCYERALVIKSNYAEAHFNLAVLLQKLKQFDKATQHYEYLVEIDPNCAEAYNNIGIILTEQGQADSATTSFNKALFININYAEAHYNLGNSYQTLKQFDNAIKHYENALTINPNYYEAYNNLGNIFKGREQYDVAINFYKKTLGINSDYAEAYNNMGNIMVHQCKFSDAVKYYQKAIRIKPDCVDINNNLGIALMRMGEFEEAIKCYKKALIIKPDCADVYNNLGSVFISLNKLDIADNYFEKTISIKPDYAEVYFNRAHLMRDLNRMENALVNYNLALYYKSNIDYILGNIINTKMHLCIWDNFSNCLIELTKKINNNERVINPFSLIALIDDPELHKRSSEIYINCKYPKNNELSKIDSYPKHSKIRIGYFSPDFRRHAVSYLTAGLYEIHDRNRFEIYAFSLGPDTKDEMNLRIKDGVDYFYDVHTMSHKEIVLLSRSLKIDIAVDLAGFTENNRTEIFAIGVAPIQLSYIGYLGTMGVDYYDYLVADQTIIPKKNQKFYSEKIVYLPWYQANDSKQILPYKKFTRETLGLPQEGFVFCCFNNTYKITPTFFDSWTRILKRVKDSVLFIYVKNDSAKINLTKEIIARDIDPSRLIFAECLPRQEHIARYKMVDLFLDTSPYNAGTTASDALRMGVPVLTRIGNSFASRHAASILNAVNLPELITTKQEEYESLAIELATDPEKLNSVKNKLVSNLPTAPLYNTALFTEHLESAYTTMYDRYYKGLEPDHIYVQNIL